jgi:small subunit ribosomal protein S3
MGHKVHPYGFRLGVSRTWNARSGTPARVTDLLKEDITIRQLVQAAGQRERQRGRDRTRHQPRHGHHPYRQAGHRHRQGRRQRRGPAPASARLTTHKVKLEIKEIRQPELDAVLVAANIAQQLTRRIAFKKAMKQAVNGP